MSSTGFKYILMAAGAVVLALLIAYQGGMFNFSAVEPGKDAPPPPDVNQVTGEAKAQVEVWPEYFEAVGTIRPRTETKVEAQVSAKVLKVNVRPGDVVHRGQLLVLLDAQQYEARLGQANQELSAAKAALDLAKADYGRIKRLYELKAAPKQDLDRKTENLKRTQAMVIRAERGVEEATLALGYTSIRAPEDGQITQRLIEPGDIALPGRTILVLETGGAMRLEALVREGLIKKVRLGQELTVSIPSLGRELTGRIEEIVPTADPQTRTFLVKAVVPQTQGLYSGMFGRLLIPAGEHKVVTAPKAAIVRVGQLETALVKNGQGWNRIYVTTGRQSGDRVEVLSGLKGDETLGLRSGGNE